MFVGPWVIVAVVFVLIGISRGSRRRERMLARALYERDGGDGELMDGERRQKPVKGKLARELAARDEQIEELQRRLYDLEERLDFTERLLANRSTESAPTSG